MLCAFQSWFYRRHTTVLLPIRTSSLKTLFPFSGKPRPHGDAKCRHVSRQLLNLSPPSEQFKCRWKSYEQRCLQDFQPQPLSLPSWEFSCWALFDFLSHISWEHSQWCSLYATKFRRVCYTVIDKQNNSRCYEVSTITILNLEISNLRLLIVDKIIMTKNIYWTLLCVGNFM